LDSGEERVSLEDSGLTSDQQDKWRESVTALDLDNPEITYDSLPKIERMAEDIYESLPEKALVIFTSTQYPRTKITADLLSTELVNRTQKGVKDIRVAFLWEPNANTGDPDSLSSVAKETPGLLEMFKEIQQQDYVDEVGFKEYFDDPSTGKTHQKELEIFYETVKRDLASESSFIRQRADQLKEQLVKISVKFADHDVPVYFFGVGHMSSLIALDVAFNGRDKYDNVDEMPTPLSLWKANMKKDAQK
jgi:hypothetical protein